ncbi:MAG TPA: hypothetical protein VFT22_02510, partial [Kofleriaceae bacterium]|nr:hypothetical protein [Kofleriaceae bacterium]
MQRLLACSLGLCAVACQSRPGAAVAPRPPDPPGQAGQLAPAGLASGAGAPRPASSGAPPGAATSAGAPDANDPVPLGPLPAGVAPVRESLALDIDPARDRFGGTADLALHVDRPRDHLWLHGQKLSVRSVTVGDASGRQLAARWDEVDPSGVARVSLPVKVAGDVTLHIAFDAAYDPQLVGVYRVATSAGPAEFSKFEAIYARRAFPCFDEPAFKTAFDITLTVPAADEVVGNMPIAETTTDGVGDGRKRVRFAS